jgi:SAM-dependent methyltransferase
LKKLFRFSLLTGVNLTTSLETIIMTDPLDLPPEECRKIVLPHSSRETLLRDSWDMYASEWIAWTRSPDQPDSYLRFHREHFLPLIPAPGRLTLDLACGEGRIARDLKDHGHRVLGLDWSFTMCKAAATHFSDPISVVAGDAARLPIADAQVDCVIAFMCLQDIDDMSGAIAEIAHS